MFPYTSVLGRRAAGLPFRRGSDDGQGKAHVPAEYPPPGEDARLPSADADESRQDDPRRETSQGPQPAHRLSLSERCALRGSSGSSVTVSRCTGSGWYCFSPPARGSSRLSPGRRSAAQCSGTEPDGSFGRLSVRSRREGWKNTTSSWYL